MEPNSPGDTPQEPPLANVVPRGSFPVPPPRRNVAGRVLMVCLVLGLIGSLLINVMLLAALRVSGLMSVDVDQEVQERFHSYNEKGKTKVAIISVEGTILSGEGFVKRQIDRALEDDSVKAVVLRVNSPGGTVTGSHFIYHHLSKLAKEKQIPIVVSMGGLAASGGYYVSMAVGDEPDTIFAEPTTWTGSIGVIIPHYDLSEMLGHWGVKQDSVTSDKFKGMGSFAKPMSLEERAIFQELVDDAFAEFKEIVKSGRPAFRPKFGDDTAAIDAVTTGRVFTAKQALDNGLIDKIGFIEDAIARAIELAKLDKDDVKVVKYGRLPSLAGLLLGQQSRSRAIDLEAILDMTAPRAYYLYTSLPPLTGSHR